MALNDQQRQAIAAIDGPPREGGESLQSERGETKRQETAEGKAQTKGSPDTEGDKMNQMPFIELDVGNGQKRKMTAEQIMGMANRYTALNHKNAQLKPVMSVIESYMQANPNMSPDQLAQTLQQLAAGQQQNVQFGKGGVNDPDGNGFSEQAKPSGQSAKMPKDEDFEKWENDNASSLPPGYKEMHGNMAQMSQAMQQMMQMMQQVMGATSGQVDAARQAQMGVKQQQAGNAQQAIANSLDQAQQRLGLPDESANDFMMFASERGYSMEDFIDPQLTMAVMNDFKNNMQSPEMERLRQIHQKRAAFTGTGSSPGGSGGGQMNPQEQDFAEFADRAVAARRM
jgi:hypothetical protein